MPQGFLVQLPTRIFTQSGTLAGGDGYLVYTYETNSTTPKATYSDGQLSSLNTNPVEADANGFVRIFIAQGDTIKCAVTDADGNSLYTFDYQQPMIPDPSAGAVTAVPVGGIIMYPSVTAPSGFLYCDGSAVSRATYSDLDTLYAGCTPAYPFGSGDGSTTFNLPDFRGFFPFGKAASGTGNAIGTTFGDIDHTHTGPSHTHTLTVTRDGWGSTLNAPSTTGRLNVGDAAGAGQFSSSYQPTADLSLTSGAGGTGATGTANPPGLPVAFMVKY